MAEGSKPSYVIRQIADEHGLMRDITYGPFLTYDQALAYAREELNMPDESFLIFLLIPPRDKRTIIHIDQTTIDDYITNPGSGC